MKRSSQIAQRVIDHLKSRPLRARLTVDEVAELLEKAGWDSVDVISDKEAEGAYGDISISMFTDGSGQVYGAEDYNEHLDHDFRNKPPNASATSRKFEKLAPPG